MAAPIDARAIGSGLVASAADTARLLPKSSGHVVFSQFPVEPFDMLAEDGGLGFTIIDHVAGQPLPPEHKSWLSIEPFKDANRDDSGDVLRARMRFLYRFVLLSMTVGGDWQSQLSHFLRDVPPHEFRWFPMLYQLSGGFSAWPQMMRSMATLRWGHPRFLIEVNSQDIKAATLAQQLELFLFGLDPSSKEVLQEQLGMQGDLTNHFRIGDAIRHHLREPQGQLPKRFRTVELGLALAGGKISTQLLTQVVDVLERFSIAQQARRCKEFTLGSRTGIEFRVTALVHKDAVEMENGALEMLTNRLVHSKHLHITTLRVAIDGALRRVSLQQCLVDLTSPRKTKLTRLTFEETNKAFSAFGSALRYDTTLQEIELGYDASDMDAFGAWLAFSIFHRDSRSNVTSVCLRMPFRYGSVPLTPPYEMCSRRWVEAFKRSLTRVASGKDLAFVHARILRGERKKNIPGLAEIRLPAGKRVFVETHLAVVYKQPAEIAKNAIFTIADQDYGLGVRQFEVVRRVEGWVAIVVPGIGVGWIRATSVVRERTAPSSTRHAGKHHRVKSFTWTGGFFPREDALKKQHADALMDLLALIGEPLEVLQLPSMCLQNGHVERIVRYCPNLRELNIAGNEITDIGPILSAFETGVCRITSLGVAQTGSNHLSVIQQVAQVIELCNHPMDGQNVHCARPLLRQVSLRVSPHPFIETARYYQRAYSVMRKALAGERGLEYIRIHCHDDDHQDTKDVFAGFLPRNGEKLETTRGDDAEAEPEDEWSVRPAIPAPVWVCRMIPLRTRLAFLSAMQITTRRRMDPHVITRILEMAQTQQPRVVDVVPDVPYFTPREYFV